MTKRTNKMLRKHMLMGSVTVFLHTAKRHLPKMEFSDFDRFNMEPSLLTDQYTKRTERELDKFGQDVFSDKLLQSIIDVQDASISQAIALLPNLPSRLTPTSYKFCGRIDYAGSGNDKHAMLEINYLWLGAKVPLNICLQIYKGKQIGRFMLSFSEKDRGLFYLAMEEDESKADDLLADVKAMLALYK